MTQKHFDFTYEKAMFKINNVWQRLSLGVSAIAHIHSSGVVSHVDINYLVHDGCQFSSNLIWLIDQNLLEEIEGAAINDAKERFEKEIEVEND